MNDHLRPAFATEIDFTLPKGFVDASGVLHRHGVMRLATAADEIIPLRDPRVQQNEAYLIVIVLARVLSRLGTLSVIDTSVIEAMYASDLAYLQQLYERLNAAGELDADTDNLAGTAPSRRGVHALGGA
jgi:hypothetical protein